MKAFLVHFNLIYEGHHFFVLIHLTNNRKEKEFSTMPLQYIPWFQLICVTCTCIHNKTSSPWGFWPISHFEKETAFSKLLIWGVANSRFFSSLRENVVSYILSKCDYREILKKIFSHESKIRKMLVRNQLYRQWKEAETWLDYSVRWSWYGLIVKENGTFKLWAAK